MNEIGKEFEELVKIISRLRHPDGCPWDRDQTSQSLIPFLIEETYELIESIDEGNWENVKEEFTEEDLERARELGLCEPVTPESVYYFKMYHDYYKGTESPIPHHWMPKWQDTNDPSGRVIPAFSENVE